MTNQQFEHIIISCIGRCDIIDCLDYNRFELNSYHDGSGTFLTTCLFSEYASALKMTFRSFWLLTNNRTHELSYNQNQFILTRKMLGSIKRELYYFIKYGGNVKLDQLKNPDMRISKYYEMYAIGALRRDKEKRETQKGKYKSKINKPGEFISI
jgi:hypothetical protein